MSEIVKIPFHGRYIHTVEGSDEPQVVLKPSVEAMGLDYARQLQKLRVRSWATVGETPTVGADGRLRDMITVDLDTWAMLLANRLGMDGAPTRAAPAHSQGRGYPAAS